MAWDMGSTSVVILGAGFSAATTNGRMPLMRGYFDRLEPICFPALHGFVSSVGDRFGDPRTANVEQVLVALDQVRTSPELALEAWGADVWKRNLPEIQRELADYTLFRLRDSLDLEDENWAAELLATCGPRTTVISMNYDNIAERILSNRGGLRHDLRNPTCPHCKMRRLLNKACSCDGHVTYLEEDDWRGAVVKPHGSISWKRCLNERCCSYGCLVADEHCRPFDPCDCPSCEDPCGPVLVMPAMSKNLSEIPELGIMWKAAGMALSDADSILLFGFSAPLSDELFVQMVRRAVQQGGRLKRIAAIDIVPDQVLERFERYLSDELQVEGHTFPVVAGERPAWLQRDCLAA